MSDTTFSRSAAPSFQPPLVGEALVERMLREQDSVWQQISAGRALPALLRQMVISSGGALAAYGVVLGLSHSPLQALVTAVKLPLLFLLTLALCLPTLYLFNLLGGGRLSVQQAMALALAAVVVPSALTAAFAPISLFFLLTGGSYPLFVLLNVAILGLVSGIGLGLLLEGATRLNRGAAAAREAGFRVSAAVNRGVLLLWMGLYIAVGTQLAATLSPFFGNPEQPFALFFPEPSFWSALSKILLRLW